MCVFCRSLFVLLYFFFWPLCCLFFFDIRILITALVSSDSSYNIIIQTNLPMQSPLLSSHMYSNITFFLSCHRKFHLNWTYFKRSLCLIRPLFLSPKGDQRHSETRDTGRSETQWDQRHSETRDTVRPETQGDQRHREIRDTVRSETQWDQRHSEIRDTGHKTHNEDEKKKNMSQKTKKMMKVDILGNILTYRGTELHLLGTY